MKSCSDIYVESLAQDWSGNAQYNLMLFHIVWEQRIEYSEGYYDLGAE